MPSHTSYIAIPFEWFASTATAIRACLYPHHVPPSRVPQPIPHPHHLIRHHQPHTMCRPSTTCYGCLHTLSTPSSPCTNRLYLITHASYRSSSDPKLRQRYKYMHSRCCRDKKRGATIMYLRMDINCEACEKAEKPAPLETDVLEISVGDVEIQVLRGNAEPQWVSRERASRAKTRAGSGDTGERRKA